MLGNLEKRGTIILPLKLGPASHAKQCLVKLNGLDIFSQMLKQGCDRYGRTVH